MTRNRFSKFAIASIAALAALSATARDLTLEDRVRYQRAIEDVYWRHRLWPAENVTPKPSLAQVMPDAAIRAKVETYLKESAALETFWQRPITREQLQAEIDRIVRDTRDERTLTELFQALDNDPDVIAETLGRQTLADRLIREWYAHDARFHGALRARAESARAGLHRPEDLALAGGEYAKIVYAKGSQEPGSLEPPALRWEDARERIAGAFADRSVRAGRISPVVETWDGFQITGVVEERDDAVDIATVTWSKVPFDAWWATQRPTLSAELDAVSGGYAISSPLSPDCVPDSWTPTSSGAPDPRTNSTAVWTGSEMIVWGGQYGTLETATGGKYSPATDTWTPTSTGPWVPAPRTNHSAVWTGTSMIVWGGRSVSTGTPLQSGGRYDPYNDAWLPVSTTGAPSARDGHTASWNGSLMIVWGGSNLDGTGGRYNPSNDTWSATSVGAGVPAARTDHTAVVIFPDIVIWGGRDSGGNAVNTGARYSPVSDTWTTVNTTGALSARWGHAAVWTGGQMLIWGGRDSGGALNNGARWQASNNLWSALTSAVSGIPTPRYNHSYVWTFGKLVLWGGRDTAGTPLNTGAVYDNATDTWTATALASAPAARHGAKAVWTGSEMILWGGEGAGGAGLSTGGRFNPSTNSWLGTSNGSYVPSARGDHVSVWTGTEMIVWGGIGGTYLNTGGRYNAATDVWTPTSVGANVPGGAQRATAVWTGSRMVVWGGYNGSFALSAGGRYDPSTDSWTATSAAPPFSERYYHTAVWTGSVMIVWGGQNGSSTPLNSGLRYDPAANTWTATSTTNAPIARLGHTAVWTGTEMIVWGGGDYGVNNLGMNTGGRYNPATNSWTATSTGTNVPSIRFYHVAVWTGSEMIVWGGNGVISGGRYNPATNTWVATSTGTGVPTAHTLAAAVWTGTEMILWGGFDAVADTATGGRYSPALDRWTATSMGTNLPSPRNDHTAVWTGSAMIVWGGLPFTATGARLCATTCASPNTYYLDADLDGYGAASSSLLACSMPTGYSTRSTDCNDANPDVNPGAFDTCNGVDRSCDGILDTAIPAELSFGTITRLGNFYTARYTWSSVPGAKYDLFRGLFAGAIGSDPFDEGCIYNNASATSWDDDGIPPGGAFWWFLVRGTNGCGDGTLGFATNHATPTTERISLVCP